MEPIEIYKSAIRAKVCSVCIDRSPNGTCAIQEDPEHRCVLYDFLPKVVDLIEANPDLDGEDLQARLRETICAQCRENVDGRCELRENVECALDRYFLLICEAIDETREYVQGGSFEGNEEYRRITHQALAQHHRLHEAENELRRAVKACVAEPNEGNFKDLLEELRQFRRQLSEHMAFEENRGFIPPLLKVQPSLEPRASSLVSDHEMFRSELDRLVKQLEESSPEVLSHEHVPEGVLKVLRELRRHEAEENSLVLEVFHEQTPVTD